MPTFLLPHEFATEDGRRKAWRSLMWEDHGFLRAVYDNSHLLGENMWRSFQPSPKHVERWARRGIKTIINLRGMREEEDQVGFWHLEDEACRQHGIELINFRAYSREAPSRDFIFGIKEIFDSIDYPAMMHCKSGADRAGISSALYMFLKEQKSLDEALEQLTYKYGHVRHGKTGVLDHFFDIYKQAAEKDGVTPTAEHFLAWVENDYDKDEVQKGFKDQWWGTLLTDKILRRE
jgi:uncharacterized protein (TIGR01244 family)